MSPELAVLYAKLDIYEEALSKIGTKGGLGYGGWAWATATRALNEATKLSQPAS
ncbi:hypothetical protein LCGC14_1460350 [marine sediment metagenome]|uniref:Uncharacterized protein n=1 Tax=marine sediment metagenome TaxID=412755 RepID=A0A0F9LVW5_9ZZZZ